MVLSNNDISCGHQAALYRCYLVLFINLLRRLHLYPFLRSHVNRYSLKPYFFCCHNCSPLLYFRRYFLFFYINIYTLNKKIYNHQAYIYMLWYTWEQKNIHIKYQKINPKNSRKIKIIKTNQRKKRTKIWILNATSMVKPWLPEFIRKALH